MSGLAGGVDAGQGINLETGAQHAEIVGPAPLGQVPDGAPAPVAPAEEYPEAVTDAAGRKLVPVEALHQARQELKAAKQLTSQMEQLREAAARGEQVEQQMEVLRPLLARLKNRPDIVAAAMAPAAPGPIGPQSPYGQDPGEQILAKHDAEDLARTLELYTAEGSPDIQRARKIALFMRRTGGEEALRVTAPVQQTVASGQAHSLQAQYSQMRDKAGRTVNPQILQQMFSIVPASLIAEEPNVAGMLYYAAKGYIAHHGMEDPQPAGRPPLVTEPSGGRAPASMPTLTDLDRALSRAMQVTEKQYTESGSRYKPGAINVLE